jgi:histidine triad (HIT) family protein
MTDCIFCKIIAKEAPASIVYEDDSFIALMDVYPLTNGHCLIMPKSHVVRLDELKASERAKLFNIGHKIVEAQKKGGLGIHGTNFLVNDGKAANQTVPHLHLHLIPRSSGDWLKSIPKIILHITGLFGLKTASNKLDEQAANIAKHMK